MSSEAPTSSTTGTLYFGYGSNLSAFQMTGRCPSSGTPIAIGRLNSWSWIISERGYANVVPMRPIRTSHDTDATTVWGILYNLTPADETALDSCEGWHRHGSGGPNPIEEQRPWKPFEQGRTTYNKMYLPLKIEKWLVPEPQVALGLSEEEYARSVVRSLVYVDEYHYRPGRILQSYVKRMGRAARECVVQGIPESYINNVFRQHGIDKDDPDSFTDDILPGLDAERPPKQQWEAIRQQHLEDESVQT